MNWARSIAGEWKLWLTAVRSLAENPVAHYLRLIARRRRQAIPTWRRYLPLIGLVLAIALLAGYYSVSMWRPGGSPKDLVHYAWILLLTIASLVLISIALRLIATTTTDTLRMLADQDNKAQRALMDEMLAASAIDDRDVVVGILSTVVPRFALVSIGGGILLWSWVATANMFDGFWLQPKAIIALLLAPVTIGSIALSGILGAVILSLWLLCHGRGSSGIVSATVVGLITAIGHFAYCPLFVIIFGANLSDHNLTVDGYGHYLWMTILVRTLVAVVFIASFELILTGTLRQRRASIATALVSPLLLPLGMLLLILLSASNRLSSELTGLSELAFIQAWGSVVVFNPLAIATRFSVGGDLISQPRWLEISYVLMIAQQVVMVVIGAHKTRQAVTRWRQQPL